MDVHPGYIISYLPGNKYFFILKYYAFDYFFCYVFRIVSSHRIFIHLYMIYIKGIEVCTYILMLFITRDKSINQIVEFLLLCRLPSPVLAFNERFVRT